MEKKKKLKKKKKDILPAKNLSDSGLCWVASSRFCLQFDNTQ